LAEALPHAKQELVDLIESVVNATPIVRPQSARRVFEIMCEHDFAFLDGIEAGAM
jgi:hypothetical protein